MTTQLSSLVFTGSPRRVRLLFSGSLAAGAFTSTSYYAVTSADGLASVPIVVETVYAIAGGPNQVELAVSEDWLPGALYTVGVTAVPTTDASDPTASLDGRLPLPLNEPVDVEPQTSDIDLLLYGRDLAFAQNGGFVEDTTGDLATISGRPNWQGAMWRRMTSEGLLWQKSYGPEADLEVDGPSSHARPLAGRYLSQARADDRTASASIDVRSTADGESWYFAMTIVGIDGLDPKTLEIPPPVSTS